MGSLLSGGVQRAVLSQCHPKACRPVRKKEPGIDLLLWGNALSHREPEINGLHLLGGRNLTLISSS